MFKGDFISLKSSMDRFIAALIRLWLSAKRRLKSSMDRFIEWNFEKDICGCAV